MSHEETYVTYKFLLTEIQKMSKEQKEDRHELNNIMQNMFMKFDDKLDSIDKQVKYTNGKVKQLRVDVDKIESKTFIQSPKNVNVKNGFFDIDWKWRLSILSIIATSVVLVIGEVINITKWP